MTEDTPTDILDITTTEYNRARIESELLTGIIGREDDVEMGIQVHQDGPDIALSAGTTYPDEPALYSYHGLTIEQAREVADALNAAAERAEAGQGKTIETDSQSLVERLLP